MGTGVGGVEVAMSYGQSERLPCYYFCSCLFVIGVLLIIILIPMSLSRLEFYEAGLLARKSTGTIDREKVWGSGLHFVGPDFHFKIFPTKLQQFSQRVSVWSKSGTGDAGTTLDLDISFQYAIRQSDIGKLYSKVALQYKPLITSYAQDAIKNTAPLFGVDDYLNSRTVIEKTMMANVTAAISNDMFVDVADLQLRKIGMTAELQATKLTAALQVESNEKEKYIQQKTLIEEQTSLDVLKIENEALRVSNAAKAQANYITERAKFLAKQKVEQARSDGLKQMLADLGLTTDEHKASLDYITTLIQNKARVKPYMNLGKSGLLQKPIS